MAREVLDSRGNPTLEVEVLTDKGSGRAIVPSGASTGVHEALELRDKDKLRFDGKGVLKAVKNVGRIAKTIVGMDSDGQTEIDEKMIELDGTANKKKLGANAILGVSMACARASANERGEFLYEYLNPWAVTLPVPMMNIINGGAHADSGLNIQEFMIMPVGADCFKEALRIGAEVFHTLKDILKKKSFSTAVGDEGGFAPALSSNEAALDLIVKAIEQARYKLWKDVMIALDSAASGFYNSKTKKYGIKIKGKFEKLSSSDLVAYYRSLLRKYPIISIEDGHFEDDWDGFAEMVEKTQGKIQIVGDDLFVTNVERLKKGIKEKAGNSVLIKVNQIGTLTETFKAIDTANGAGWTAVVSHRSGETEDTTIADLCVAKETGQIKTGSLSRTERICKYNQLLRIEERLGKKAVYLGREAFYNLGKDYYTKPIYRKSK